MGFNKLNQAELSALLEALGQPHDGPKKELLRRLGQHIDSLTLTGTTPTRGRRQPRQGGGDGGAAGAALADAGAKGDVEAGATRRSGRRNRVHPLNWGYTT